MKNARDIRFLYDIFTILGTSKRIILCPLPQHPHQNYSPSFSIYTDKDGTQIWKCHGSCGLHGDVIDLIGYTSVPGYNSKDTEHVGRAIALLSGGHEITPPTIKKVTRQGLPNDLWKEFTPADDELLTYTRSRGLSDEIVRLSGIGKYVNDDVTYMTIPFFDGGRLKGIKLRNLNSNDNRNRYRQYPGSENGLYNVNGIRSRVEPIVIVKGEISTMNLLQYGFLACAPTGGESAWAKAEGWYLQMCFSRHRILIKDNDINPETRIKEDEHAVKRARALQADLKAPPEEYKDVDDWIQAEGASAIDTIRKWTEEG